MRRFVCWLSVALRVAPQILAQNVAVPAAGTFDLELEKRFGRGASVVAFVARDSHVYFAVSGSNGLFEVQTTLEGMVERSSFLGAEPVSGFDVDEAGNAYVIRDGSGLSEFDSQGAVFRTVNLQRPMASLALMASRPMGLTSDGTLYFLDGSIAGLTLAAYPKPWLLFAVGPDRVAVLRPQSGTLHVMKMEERDFSEISIVWLGQRVSARKPIAAAGDQDGRIYLLGERGTTGSRSVIECDSQGEPKFLFNYALPAAFNPRMIGVTGGEAFLTDPAGKVMFCCVGRDTVPAEVLDRPAHLLTDLEPIRAAVRKTGYTGRVSVLVDISSEGVPRNPRVQSPGFLANVREVMQAIGSWRFQPAIKAGDRAAVPMELNIDVF